MGSEWKLTTLLDIALLNMGLVDGPFGSNLPASLYEAKGIPVIRGNNLSLGQYKFKDMDFVFVSEDTFKGLKRSECISRDIIFTKKGTLGQTGIIPDQSNYEKYLLSSNQMRLRVDEKKAVPLYIYYCVSSKKVIEDIKRDSEHTGVPKINLGYLKSFKISLPPLKEQKAIAHILGSLDDKIELNRQMNTILEAMAQALFKSWFVDFDPVLDNALAAGNPIPDELQAKAAARLALGDARKSLPAEIQALFPSSFVLTEEMGWIPEGWEDLNLSSLLEVKYGKDHKHLEEGNIPVYGSGGLMRYAELSLYSGESILIPRKGTLSNLMYVNETFWTVDTMFYSVPKIENVAKYLFYVLKTFDLSAMNVGSAVPSMTTKVLNDLKVIKPSHAILNAFENYLSGLFDKKRNLENENSTLIKLRDTLLLKLLSGELRIPDAESYIGCATINRADT